MQSQLQTVINNSISSGIALNATTSKIQSGNLTRKGTGSVIVENSRRQINENKNSVIKKPNKQGREKGWWSLLFFSLSRFLWWILIGISKQIIPNKNVRCLPSYDKFNLFEYIIENVCIRILLLLYHFPPLHQLLNTGDPWEAIGKMFA